MSLSQRYFIKVKRVMTQRLEQELRPDNRPPLPMSGHIGESGRNAREELSLSPANSKEAV